MSGFDTSRVRIAKEGQPYVEELMDLRGGVNNSLHDELIADNQLADARNYMPDHLNSGVLVKRLGITKHLANQQTALISSIYQGAVDDWFTSGTQIKRFSSNTAIFGAVTAAAQFSWCTLAGIDMFADRALVPKKISSTGVATVAITTGGSGYAQNDTLTISPAGDANCTLNVDTVVTGAVTEVTITVSGSGYTATGPLVTSTSGAGTGCTLTVLTLTPAANALGGSPPTFKYMEVYNNFVWGAGHSTGVLRYSTLATAQTWPSTNSLTITNDENDDITGLKKYNSALMVFCEQSFHRVTGFADLEATLAWSNYTEGCTSHRSIVSTPFGLFWWTDNGMARSIEGYQVDDYPTARLIPNTLDGLNKSQYTKVHGVYHKRLRCVEYYVCYGSAQTTENMSLWYFPPDATLGRIESMWIMDGTGTQMVSSASARISGVQDVYLGPVSATSYFYKQSGTTDDGAGISGYIETKRTATYGIKTAKNCDNITLAMLSTASNDLRYGVYVDNSTVVDKTWNIAYAVGSGIILGTSTLPGVFGSDGEGIEYTIGYKRKYKKLKHRIYDANTARTKLRGIINSGTILST